MMGLVPGLCGQWPALLQHEHQNEAYQPFSEGPPGQAQAEQRQQQHQCQVRQQCAVVQMLCKALLRNTAVRVLVLSDCELGRDGARVLAEMLSRNASLNELVASSLATPCLMHSPTPLCTC